MEGKPAEARFTQGQKALNIPIRTDHNLIFVPCQVNGSDPEFFILDTGATFTVLDQEFAQRRGLDLSDRQRTPRTGLEYIQVSDLTIGLPGVEVTAQPAKVMDIKPLTLFTGCPITGILGYDLIKELVLDIDYDAKMLHAHDPGAYSYSGPGEKIPMTIMNKWPVIPVRIAPADGAAMDSTIVIDSGSLMSLSLINGDLARKTIDNAISVGIGGVGAGGRLGRVEFIQLGSFRINRPLAGFPPPGVQPKDPISQSLANAGLGLIGGEILCRFRTIYDYSRQTLTLETGQRINEPVEGDMSGAFLTAEGESFKTIKIIMVADGSPGQRAGLLSGDIIAGVDGLSVGQFDLAQTRTLLKRDGETRRLRILRGTETIDIILPLRRMI